jgi:amino acid adenylation domain-containing protein
LFEEQVVRTPDAVAVVYEGQQLTYAQLNARANQLAHYLQLRGVGAEVVVALYVERSLELIVGMLGILKAGAAYLPLEPAYPTERLALMLEDAKVAVLLTQQQLVKTFPEHIAEVICLDTDWDLIAQQSQENLHSDIKPENLAYVLFTSGSTGQPKGVAVEHRQLCNYLNAIVERLDLSACNSFAYLSTIAADLGNTTIFPSLCKGGCLHIVSLDRATNPEALADYFHYHPIDCLKIVPSHLANLLTSSSRPKQILPRQSLILGGDICSWQLIEQIRQLTIECQIFNHYGPTEATVGVLTYAIAPEYTEGYSDTLTIGRPLTNIQIYILDSHLQPVPIGVPGELHIAGVGLARGYLNRPELTTEKFIPNPFSTDGDSRLYKTGDLARYLPNGNIEYLGRIDNQVKIRGFRIELGEIETVLNQHPQVHSVVVNAGADTPGDQRLVAYIVPQQNTAPTISELRQFLKAKLPEYMVPSAFVILEALPLTPNGKVDRRALPTPDTNNKAMQASFVPPLDIVEQKLAEIWAEVLKVYPVGVRDNFFDLGGHSLLAVQLMARIEQQFQKNLPLATLFQNSTIEQLATILRQPIDALNWSALVPIQPNGSKRPFFCVPGAGGNTIYLYNLAHHLGKDQPFYGLQSLGLDGESKPHTLIEDMAAYYIEAIQSIQPSGPYLLGGHSFGGKVAFEMATQLHKRGYEVALVALLDAGGPGYRTNELDVARVDDARWMKMIAGIIETLYAKSLNVSDETLKALAPDEQLNYFKEQLQMVNFLPPDVGIKQVRGFIQVFKTNHQIASVYMPQSVYPAQITLFKASEIDAVSDANSETLDEPGLGWDKFSAQPLDIHLVPGDHNTMLNEPHVQVLAQQLRICIERSQADD